MTETIEVELETEDLEETVRRLMSVLDSQPVVAWEMEKSTEKQ